MRQNDNCISGNEGNFGGNPEQSIKHHTERERMTNNKNIVQLHIYAVVEMVCFMPVCHIGAFCWWKMT